MLNEDRIASLIARSNATILEIGANNGTDTLKLCGAAKYGIVFAFEPDPRAIQRFKEHVDHERIHLIESAVGATVGNMKFYQSSGVWPYGEEQRIIQKLSKDWDQSGSIRKPKKHIEKYPWVTFENEIDVPVTTFDNWTMENRIKFVDFIWADVQGAEADLIEGATNTLQYTRYFYTEFSHDELYEGALGLDDISSRLVDFDLLEVFEQDALFINRRWIDLF